MKDLLIGKASGITKAIDAMDGAQRQRLPSVAFGEDYNRLRTTVGESFPQLKALLPPTVGRSDTFDGSDATYAEIRTYAEQIYQMLGALDE